MIGTYELVILWLSVGFSLATVVVCLRQRCFYRYFFLNLYLLACLIFTVGGWYIIRTDGYNSGTYFYFYFIGDAFTTTFAYLAVGSLFAQMFRQSIFRPYVRPTLVFSFLLVVGISVLFISGSVDRMRLFPRFVIEFEQNMYFMGVLLTLLLWLSMTSLRAESRRFVLLVSGLGVYFSAHAANYALRFLFRDLQGEALKDILTSVPPLAYTFMVVLWLYTFWRVPEGEAAVAPVPRLEESLVKVKISLE